MSPLVQRPLIPVDRLNYCPEEPPVLQCLPAEPVPKRPRPLEIPHARPSRFPRILEELARQNRSSEPQPFRLEELVGSLSLFGFGLLGFLALGISGCTSDQAPYPALGPIRTTINDLATRYSESEEFAVQHDLVEYPDVGYLLHLRDRHFWQEMSDAELEELFDYQLRLLRILEILRPRHVFLEALSNDLRGSDIRPGLAEIFSPSPNWDYVLGSLLTAEEVPDELNSERQIKWLVIMGAGLIYGMRHPDFVFLHRTNYLADLERNIRLHTELDSCIEQIGNDLECIGRQEADLFDRREATAAGIMAGFFRRNRGAEAVLIYGALHQFCDDFRSREMPISVASLSLTSLTGALVMPPPCDGN